MKRSVLVAAIVVIVLAAFGIYWIIKPAPPPPIPPPPPDPPLPPPPPTTAPPTPPPTTPPAPDFTMTISPSRKVIHQGEHVSYTISIVSTGGFSSEVTIIDVSGLPPDASCLIIPGTGVKQVLVTAGTTTGSFDIIVTGRGGGITHTAACALEIETAPFTPAPTTTAPPPTPGPPTLVEAINRGLIKVEFRGTGYCAGHAIKLKITLKISISGEIEITPALILINSGSGQNMIVAESRTVTVRPGVELELDIEAYCLDLYRDNPSTEETFSMQTHSGSYGENVMTLMRSLEDLPRAKKPVAAVQIALWVVTDDVIREDITIHFSDEDIEAARWLLENAGIDVSNKRLFR